MRFLMGLALILLSLQAALAAQFSVTIRQSPGYQTLRLSGNLGLGDYSKAAPIFDQLDPTKKILVMELNFGGGVAAPIEAFAKRLKKYCDDNACTLVTVVRSSSVCASYCMPIYMTGDVRATVEGAKFGLHTMTMWGMISDSRTVMSTYAKYGVSRSWLDQHKEYFVSRDVTWLTPPQMGGAGVVTNEFSHEREFVDFLQTL